MNPYTYFRGYKDPHNGLRPYSKIARSIPGLSVLKVPMHIPKSYKKKFNGVFSEFFFKLLAHILLFSRVRANSSQKIIVREFLTIPLFICIPILWLYRNRLYFLCQHNLAFAHKKKSHRFSLKALHLLGFKFIVYDDVALWSFISSVNKNIFSLPHPLPNIKQSSTSSTLTLGFIGNFRKEKSPEWAINELLLLMNDTSVQQEFCLLLGSPSMEFLNVFKGNKDVITIDTTDYKDYLQALTQCDVLILPYEKESYSYRNSGVLAEAVATGTAIVIPCIPGLIEQLCTPSKVGECYSSKTGFSKLLKTMLPKLADNYYDNAIKEHKAHRGEYNIRILMENLLND